jgi:hypothetical protein
MHEKLADRLAILILVAVGLIAALTFRDYGLGWDDYTHSEYGDMLLALYRTGFADDRALSFVNLFMYGGGFDMVAGLLAKILPFDLFETRRLVGAATGLAGLIATWRIGRHLGGPWAGLLALVLLATCPLYYGHMFMNAKDAPFAVALTILLLGMVRTFAQYPKPSPATVVLLGIGIGLTFGSRIMGGIAAVSAVAALILIVVIELRALGWREAAARLGRFMLALLPGLALAYVVMGFIWPWAVINPLNPVYALQYFSHFFEKPWPELFDGAVLAVPDMPRSYVPQLFALTLPEVLLALGSAGVIAAFVNALRPALPLNRRAVLLLVATAATFPILYAVVARPAMYNGVRHFVFVMPPLAALGGYIGATILAQVQRLGRLPLSIAGGVLLGCLAIPVIDMVRLHPYEYTHFNRASGGIRMAASRYMLDYWGLSFKQAAEALRHTLAMRGDAPPQTRPWKVAVCGPQRPAEVGLGPEFETDWKPQGADFALTLGAFYCLRLDAPVMLEVTRNGVVYARVYDLRGRSVPTLLTMPPPT